MRVIIPCIKLFAEKEDQLERVAREFDQIEDYVVVNGELIPKIKALATPSDKVIAMPEKPVYYWYDRDERGKALFKFELQCIEEFKQEYNNSAFNYKVQINSDDKLDVLIDFPFKPSENVGWEIWQFRMIFDHDHPTMRKENTLYGGSIKMFPISHSVGRIPHMTLMDSSIGLRYVCLEKERDVAEINAYAALQDIFEWLTKYYELQMTKNADEINQSVDTQSHLEN